jgi:hypothetical protein
LQPVTAFEQTLELGLELLFYPDETVQPEGEGLDLVASLVALEHARDDLHPPITLGGETGADGKDETE